MIGLIFILAIMLFFAYLMWCDVSEKMRSSDNDQFTKWLNGDSDRMV